jgi:hypothetical protein
MSIKVCYVVTCSEWDMYTKMLYISASAVRRLYPAAQVVLVTDTAGASFARRKDYPLFGLLTEVMEASDAIGSDPLVRSRYLKTSLRQRVNGDFLFLDADTLPIRPFEQILQLGGAMAAADDRNRDYPYPHVPPHIKPHYRSLGWRLDVDRYYNTGVLLFRDTSECHKLCDEWHRRWRHSAEQGVYYDQPAYNSAVNELGISVSTLQTRFNAMVDADPALAKGAAILHFYAKARYFDKMIMAYLVNQLKAPNWHIDGWEAVGRCASAGHPWAPPCLPPLLWQSGNYFRAVLASPLRPMTVLRPFAQSIKRTGKKMARMAIRCLSRGSLFE